jgi:predicted 2-oxoglutarate/Fe(II)-dependent dioxygenase YbiX
MEWLANLTPETRYRRFVERRWTQAIVRGDWRMEEILFDHLWPGVFDLDTSYPDER